MAEVQIVRHVPACNDLCVECVLFRRLDAAIAGYELKVQDLAAETQRTSDLLAENSRLSDELVDVYRDNFLMAPVVEAVQRQAECLHADGGRSRLDADVLDALREMDELRA